MATTQHYSEKMEPHAQDRQEVGVLAGPHDEPPTKNDTQYAAERGFAATDKYATFRMRFRHDRD